MTGVTIQIDDGEVRGTLQKLLSRLSHMRPAMEKIGATVEGFTRLRFVRQTDPWGTPWKPLSQTTIARRRKGSNVPLRDTGRLMNSITHRVISNNTVEVGTNVKYAPTHQFGAKKGAYGRTRRGASIPWGNVPARAFLPLQRSGPALPESLMGQIEKITNAYLMETQE
jgi:phage virion morphogenesis protein